MQKQLTEIVLAASFGLARGRIRAVVVRRQALAPPAIFRGLNLNDKLNLAIISAGVDENHLPVRSTRDDATVRIA